MGAGKSNRKNRQKKDHKPNVGHNFAEEINDTTVDQHSQNIVNQKITSEINEDPGADDYKKHKKKQNTEVNKLLHDKDVNDEIKEKDIDKTLQDQNSEDNSANKIKQENVVNSDENNSNTGDEGILSNKTNFYDGENQEAKENNSQIEVSDGINNFNEVDKDIKQDDKSKCENEGKSIEKDPSPEDENDQMDNSEKAKSDSSQTEATHETKKKSKSSGRHVSWSDKVTCKTDDGTISEEDLKSCDSCGTITKKAYEIRKKLVEFTKKKPETSNDQGSSDESKEEDSTRKVKICDSCDLELSRKVIKKNEEK